MRSLISLALLVSCNDYPNQLVVTFDTDALVVSGEPDALDAPTSLFDTLLVEVSKTDTDAACAGCTRSFSVTRDMFQQGKVSIGIPLPADGARLRARLYLSRLAPTGDPSSDATIDKLVALPPASANPQVAGVFLATDLVGQPKDPLLDTPDPLDPRPASSRVGTWAPAAKRVPCNETMPHPATAACVAGGAYWMGTMDGGSVGPRSAQWHRLAVLSPFYLDTAPVTVGQLRAAKMAAQVPNNPADPTSVYCTYTTAPGPYENLPVNCVSPDVARSYCRSVGGDLPTGAQYEFVATRFGRAIYAWGFDQPTCADAVFDDCRYEGCGVAITTPGGCFATTGVMSPLKDASGNIGGPLPAPSCVAPDCALRDALHVDNQDIVHLNGNLSEPMLDQPFSESDSCYAGHVLTNPTCPAPFDQSGAAVQLRGAPFSALSYASLRGDTVDSIVVTAPSKTVGFRCVYPATP